MEKQKRATECKEDKHYVCDQCKEKYDLTEARKRELACCGQPLLRTEVITKSDPTPFGP